MIVTFLAGLFAGVQIGLLAGMIISIGILLEHAAYPQMAVLQRTKFGTLQNKIHYDESEPIPNVCIVRLEASLFFTNVARFKAFCHDSVSQHDYEPNPQIAQSNTERQDKWLLLDFSGVNDIDFSGLSMLESLAEDLREDDVLLVLASLKGRVVRNIEQYEGLREQIGGARHLCLNMENAMKVTQGERGNPESYRHLAHNITGGENDPWKYDIDRPISSRASPTSRGSYSPRTSTELDSLMERGQAGKPKKKTYGGINK